MLLPGHMSRHFAIAHAPSHTSASNLALPDDVVSAGKGTQGSVPSGQGPYASYHNTWNGFQSGVAAVFDFKPIMTLFYEGSVFSDTGSAAAYMADSFKLTSSWPPIAPKACNDSAGVPCEIAGYFHISSASQTFPVTVTFVVSRNGRTLGRLTRHPSINQATGDYRASAAFKLPKKSGPVDLDVQVVINNQTQDGTATIKVAKR